MNRALESISLPEPEARPLPARRVPRSLLIQLITLSIGVLAIGFLMVRFGSYIESLGPWGYIGVAAAEFGNSAVLLPTPVPAYTFAMGAVLNPLAVGLVVGVFAALGELVCYCLGRRGSAILPTAPSSSPSSRGSKAEAIMGLFGI